MESTKYAITATISQGKYWVRLDRVLATVFPTPLRALERLFVPVPVLVLVVVPTFELAVPELLLLPMPESRLENPLVAVPKPEMSDRAVEVLSELSSEESSEVSSEESSELSGKVETSSEVSSH